MIDLKPIRVFLTVANRQSFSAAARDLGLAAASVTRIVAQLEETLGAQLLVRTTRQVALTSAGAVAAARYRPLVEGFDDVTADLLRTTRPDTGTLRITAPVSLGLQLMPRVIAGFRMAYPGISVDITFTDTLVDVIAETCDLAIRVSGPPTDKSTIWRKLCEVPRRAIAAPILFDRMPEPRHPDDLTPDATMSYSATGVRETWEFSQAATTRTIRAGSRVISNNGDFLYAMARAGEGDHRPAGFHHRVRTSVRRGCGSASRLVAAVPLAHAVLSPIRSTAATCRQLRRLFRNLHRRCTGLARLPGASTLRHVTHQASRTNRRTCG